ncbi:hypothetical protein CEP53_004563 [Fusarium sp. AF-6]|nr:hypothetical protein CEP53_004563 [Fusarium sp. AF-6]
MSEKRRDEAVMELSSTIMQQMNSDPLLPRANPTVSPWQVPAHPSVANVQSPELPDMTDYVVIGSGITACGVVKTLLSSTSISSNKTVTVFEARQLCSSATGRNGGQLTRVPLARHAQLVKQLGADQANKVVRLTLKTLQEMHKLAEAQTPELERDCRHQRLEKFYAYYDEKLFEDAKKLVEFCETHIPEERGMIKIVSREECCKLHGLNRAVGGFRFPAGVTSPYRLVTNVFQSLLDKYGDRLSIETNTPITNMQYQPETNVGYPYIVTTPRGHSRAATIIHCTNGHAGHLLPGLRGAIYPARGIMSLHSPGNKFPDRSHTQSWSYFVRPWYDRKSDTVERGHYYAHQHPGTKQLWVRGHLDSVAGYITSDDTEVDNAAATNIITS